jgi:hypothetical protein
MCAKKKNDPSGGLEPDQAQKIPEVFHAMRNGILYRSKDGIRWELETDPNVLAIPEGTSRITIPK